MFGGLLASGWTLDQILELTWDQSIFVAESLMLHKVQMLNMVSEPVLAAMGAKFKRNKVGGKRTKREADAAKRKREHNPKGTDAALLFSIQNAGFGVGNG